MARISRRSQNQSMAMALESVPANARVSAEAAYDLAISFGMYRSAFKDYLAKCEKMDFEQFVKNANNEELDEMRKILNSLVSAFICLNSSQKETGIVLMPDAGTDIAFYGKKAKAIYDEKMSRIA